MPVHQVNYCDVMCYLAAGYRCNFWRKWGRPKTSW